MIELNQRFRRRSDFVYRVVAGQAVLVPVRAGVADLQSIFTLNEVGSEVWERIAPERTVGEIVDAITGAFSVSPQVASDDVRTFLERLLGVGVIEAVPGTAAGHGV